MERYEVRMPSHFKQSLGQYSSNSEDLLTYAAIKEKLDIRTHKFHPDSISSFRHILPDNSFSLAFCPFSTTLENLPTVADEIYNTFRQLNYEYLNLLSLGISQPKHPMYIGVHPASNQMVIFYRNPSTMEAASEMLYLGVLSYLMMSADRIGNHDLVSRITSIMSKRPVLKFFLADEEQEEVDRYLAEQQKLEALHNFKDAAEEILFKPRNYDVAINSAYESIREYEEELAVAHQRLADLKAEEYLSMFEENDSKEFLEYIKDERLESLAWATQGRHSLTMILRSHLDITKDDAFFAAITNPNHKLHAHRELAALLQAAMNGDILIPVLGSIMIRREPGKPIEIRGTSEYDNSVPDSNSMLLNPHVNHYNCFTQNKKLIKQYLEKGEVIHMFEQCVATVGSLNLHDGPAMSKLIMSFNHKYNRMTIKVRTDNGWKDSSVPDYLSSLDDDYQAPSRAEDNQYMAETEDVPF